MHTSQRAERLMFGVSLLFTGVASVLMVALFGPLL